MSSTLKKLEKILKLERDQGYRNRAVIGGLKRFLSRWTQEALSKLEDERARRQIHIISELLRGYENKDAASRASSIQEALKQLRNTYLPEEQTAPSVKTAMPAPPHRPSRSEPPSQPGPEAERDPEEDVEATIEKAVQLQHRTPRSQRDLQTPVEALRGVSDTYRRRLHRLGLYTVEDLLYFFPRRYDDFSALKTINKLQYGEEVTIVGTVWEAKNRRTRSGRTLTSAIFSDATGTLEATWFNQPYLTRELRPGRKIVLSGRVEKYLGRLTFQSPEWEPLEQQLVHTARLVPVYPLTQGVSARWMRKLMLQVVQEYAAAVPEYLPAAICERQNLPPIDEALRQIHFPDSWEKLHAARRRLSFDEFLLIQLGVLRQRRAWQQENSRPLAAPRELLGSIRDALPFRLTTAQDRALKDILRDMTSTRPMSRLLQGDVGSGKTIVAMIAMLVAVANQAQAALMAPTEILAEQHYQSLLNLLDLLKLPPAADGEPATGFARPEVRLLTGSLTPAQKNATYQEIAEGTVDIVIGTHALIQESVTFKDLAFVVIDEQHRFGVGQRSRLRQKGYAPHVLVMTATPIPRTLALTVYGDLDLSIIDEMPPGRQTIKTRKVLPRERERAYQFVRAQVKKGRQAFIICPLIEASEKIEAKAAKEEYERLQKQVFPDLRLGLMHGKLKNEEKEKVMQQFRDGELDILVSTSVIEVGIDVPNATVVLIEGADRFGLAQLHQFRGRVGRGEHQSYCLLLTDSPSQNAQTRLDILENTQDGFRLAEEDLKLRGPGEFFGTRQSGLPDLKAAKLSDVAVLEAARAEALEIFRQDPDLTAPEHADLVSRVNEFWRGEGDLS